MIHREREGGRDIRDAVPSRQGGHGGIEQTSSQPAPLLPAAAMRMSGQCRHWRLVGVLDWLVVRALKSRGGGEGSGKDAGRQGVCQAEPQDEDGQPSSSAVLPIRKHPDSKAPPDLGCSLTMRSCAQRFQCRCSLNMRSQLWSVARGLPFTHVLGICVRTRVPEQAGWAGTAAGGGLPFTHVLGICTREGGQGGWEGQQGAGAAANGAQLCLAIDPRARMRCDATGDGGQQGVGEQYSAPASLKGVGSKGVGRRGGHWDKRAAARCRGLAAPRQAGPWRAPRQAIALGGPHLSAQGLPPPRRLIAAGQDVLAAAGQGQKGIGAELLGGGCVSQQERTRSRLRAGDRKEVWRIVY